MRERESWERFIFSLPILSYSTFYQPLHTALHGFMVTSCSTMPALVSRHQALLYSTRANQQCAVSSVLMFKQQSLISLGFRSGFILQLHFMQTKLSGNVSLVLTSQFLTPNIFIRSAVSCLPVLSEHKQDYMHVTCFRSGCNF